MIIYLEKIRKKYSFGTIFAFMKKGAQIGRLFNKSINLLVLLSKINGTSRVNPKNLLQNFARGFLRIFYAK
jgi:hypothetical protein